MDGNPVRTHNGTTRLSSTQQKVTSLYKGRCLPWHHVPWTHCPLDSPFSLRCRPSSVPPPSQSTLSPNSLSSPCTSHVERGSPAWSGGRENRGCPDHLLELTGGHSDSGQGVGKLPHEDLASIHFDQATLPLRSSPGQGQMDECGIVWVVGLPRASPCYSIAKLCLLLSRGDVNF